LELFLGVNGGDGKRVSFDFEGFSDTIH